MEAQKKPTIYPPDLKLAAVRAFLDGGLTRREVVERYEIASISTFKKWVIAYRREGAPALASKKQGRPRKRWVSTLIEPPEVAVFHAEVERLKRKLESS